MATKKKTRKKSKKTKRTAAKKATVKTSVKRPKAATKNTARKKTKKKASSRKQTQPKTRRGSSPEFSPKGARSQSGDLQGLSRSETADSESVEELLEEGNAFEADAVIGVEDAENSDEKEVRTHEVPEDDVPGEYLDEE